MSGERLSAATQALLKAARHDAPSAAARAKMWSGVSAGVGGAAGASAGAGGAGVSGVAGVGAGSSAAKMLVGGTLLGGAVTVGLAAMLLHVGPTPGQPPPSAPAVVAVVAPAALPQPAAVPGVVTGAPPESAVGVTVTADVGPAGRVAGAPAAVPAKAIHISRPSASSRSAHGAPAGPTRPAEDDPLAREASLVAQARSALASGDAQLALRLVRAARSMPAPQLVPEELTVEAQALRSLGNADEARAADATLRSQYPESAFAK